VAVLGDDEVARWAALSLVRNGAGSVALSVTDPALTAELAGLAAAGCPVSVSTVDAPGSYDVLVVTPSAGPARLLELLRAGLPAEVTVLPAWTLGERVIVGPTTVAGVAGCWACAALRLGSAADPGAAARLWSSVALGSGAADAPLRGPLAAMVGNLLGYEVFRLRTGVLPVETSGRVLVQDVASLDVTAQPLLPDPRCPFCATGPGPAPDRDAVLAWRPVVLPADPSDDADDVLAELEARSVLVQPDTGPFLRYADETVTQLPLKVGTVEVAVGPGEVCTVTAYDVRHVAGARLRALETAATLYTDHTVPLTLAGATGDVGGRSGGGAPARTDGADASGVGAAGATGNGGGAGVGRDVELGALGTASGVAGAVSAWVAGESLLSGEAVRVPAAAARPYGAANAAGLVTRTSAGLGAASTPAGAVVAGLLSALAFAALDRALRRQGPVSRVDLAVADPQLTFLVRSAGTLGVELELLELAAPVPVLLARTGDGPLWAVAAATEWTAAAVAAVRDLLGQVQQPGADRGDPLLADLDPAALVPTGTGPATPDRTVPVPDLLDRLRAEGTDVLVVPSGSADLRAGGLHVARVLLEAGRAG
jgi:bacteriocin biosynthesis cyclodehydratase domain-containing protein